MFHLQHTHTHAHLHLHPHKQKHTQAHTHTHTLHTPPLVAGTGPFAAQTHTNIYTNTHKHYTNTHMKTQVQTHYTRTLPCLAGVGPCSTCSAAAWCRRLGTACCIVCRESMHVALYAGRACMLHYMQGEYCMQGEHACCIVCRKSIVCRESMKCLPLPQGCVQHRQFRGSRLELV